MAEHVVTRDGDKINTVAIDIPPGVPHSTVLEAIATTLTRWQDQAGRLADHLAELRAQGIYLDPDDEPIIPGWSERRENGRHVAWYLIWPREHVRRTGCKRLQYVRAAKLEATRAKAERTQEYRDTAARRQALLARVEQVGGELYGLIRRHNMVTEVHDEP